MKVIFLALCLLTHPLLAEVITIKPQGEYATINVKLSYDAVEILMSSFSLDTVKREIASEIEKKPGSYNPGALIALGNYYLTIGIFDKAAFWHRAGMLRTTIDLRIYNDPSLQDVIPILFHGINSENKIYLNKPNKVEAYKKGLVSAGKMLLDWDLETPRDYDDRWICLHSTQAILGGPLKKPTTEEKLAAIKEEHRLFKLHN